MILQEYLFPNGIFTDLPLVVGSLCPVAIGCSGVATKAHTSHCWVQNLMGNILMPNEEILTVEFFCE